MNILLFKYKTNILLVGRAGNNVWRTTSPLCLLTVKYMLSCAKAVLQSLYYQTGNFVAQQ